MVAASLLRYSIWARLKRLNCCSSCPFPNQMFVAMSVAAGQVISRLKLNWLGKPATHVGQAAIAFKIIFLMVTVYFTIYIGLNFLLISLDPNLDQPVDSPRIQPGPDFMAVLWIRYVTAVFGNNSNSRSSCRTKMWMFEEASILKSFAMILNLYSLFLQRHVPLGVLDYVYSRFDEFARFRPSKVCNSSQFWMGRLLLLMCLSVFRFRSNAPPHNRLWCLPSNLLHGNWYPTARAIHCLMCITYEICLDECLDNKRLPINNYWWKSRKARERKVEVVSNRDCQTCSACRRGTFKKTLSRRTDDV